MDLLATMRALAQDEGEDQTPGDGRFHAYRCSSGKLTIGHGRNIDPDGGRGLSREEAEFLLRNDVLDARGDLERLFGALWERIDEVRQGALVNMRFQLGPRKFRAFRQMIAAVPAAVESGDWTEVAREAADSVWSGARPGRPGASTPERAARVILEIRSGIQAPRT